MPLLVSASVAILSLFSDCCSLSEYGDCGDDSCEGCIQDDSSCVLPQSISKVSTLELLAVTEIMFIFRRDLKWCPTFGGLKTLVLNKHWWVPDVRALSCILEHAPVLEKLRLCIVSKGLKLNVKMKGCFNQKELPSTISAPLKRVVVRCAILDERVLKLLKFLSKLNICFRF